MLCVISAIFSEISRLVELTGAQLIEDSIWYSEQKDLLVVSAGVGYLESAIQLQSLLFRFTDIKKVIFCGSAGVYPGVNTIKTGDVCLCQETILCDSAAEIGLGLYASILPRNAIQSNLEINDSLCSSRVLTTLSLTANDDLAISLRQNTKADLENMELYGIASVCQKHSVLWNAILGITNIVGCNGHQEWSRNFRAMGKLASDFLFKNMKETEEAFNSD
ncbi:hypothetical protein KKA14_17320 [bacterium]|nr:hypothetical protein [bacterium]